MSEMKSALELAMQRLNKRQQEEPSLPSPMSNAVKLVNCVNSTTPKLLKKTS